MSAADFERRARPTRAGEAGSHCGHRADRTRHHGGGEIGAPTGIWAAAPIKSIHACQALCKCEAPHPHT